MVLGCHELYGVVARCAEYGQCIGDTSSKLYACIDDGGARERTAVHGEAVNARYDMEEVCVVHIIQVGYD